MTKDKKVLQGRKRRRQLRVANFEREYEWKKRTITSIVKIRKQSERTVETNDSFLTPKERKNELLQRVNDGLSDVPISTNFTKIPMPGDEQHVVV